MRQIIIHSEKKEIDIYVEDEPINLEMSYNNNYCMTNLKVKSNGYKSSDLYQLLQNIENKVKQLNPFNNDK